MASIENGEGKEVDDGEIEADKTEPKEGIFDSRGPAVLKGLDDSDGACQVFGAH